MNKLHRYLLILSRAFVGIIFIYSGFVKGIDPLGFTYKLNDYFTAFGTEWASSLSFTLSVLLSLLEFVIGAALLLNLKIKLSSLGALLFMVVFTPLTFVLAINNPVQDCGCFGDALIITNWQTFWKNLIILIPVVYIFVARKKITAGLQCREQWMAIGIIALFMAVLTVHSYNHLPLIDFRPYKVGTHIPNKMTIPQGATIDQWESIFIYAKKGREKEFGIKNLPDSTWTFVDAKHVLIKKGYEPPIHDFSITSADYDEITDLVLASENYNFLLVAYNLDKSSDKNIEKINELAGYCLNNGYNFYGLTASPGSVINSYIQKTGVPFDYYSTDEITLKTIVRSNPGLVLVKSGTIIDKWHYNDIPDVSELENDLSAQSITKYKKHGDNYFILLLIVASGLMISLYLLIRKTLCTKK